MLVYDLEGRVGGAYSALGADAAGAASVRYSFPGEFPCENLEPPNRPMVFSRLAASKIIVQPHSKLLPQANGAMRLRDTWSGRDDVIADVDLIIVAGYRTARSALAAAVTAEHPALELHVIGDCHAPRLLRNAVSEGARAGISI